MPLMTKTRNPAWYVRALSYALRKPSRVLAKLLASLLEPDPLAAASHRDDMSERQLLAAADDFNRKAELYWQAVDSQAPARQQVLNKPFGSGTEAADVLYRLGLLLQELRAGIGHTVLDFGAGSCWLSVILARLGCETVSVDVSPTALKLGRELFASESHRIPEAKARFLPYDGHRLPMPGASVDRVVCFDAFHHIPNQSEVLAEFHRVLRDGGRVVLAEPGEGHSHADQAVFETEVHGVLENELDLADLVRRAEALGFRDFEVKPYPSPSALSVSPRDYLRIINGREEVFPFEALQSSLRHFYLLAFNKGPFSYDTRSPHQLRAAIRPEVEEIRGTGGSIRSVAVKVQNRGDTRWLSTATPEGGFVHIGGHLLDRSGALVQHDHLPRHTLPCDVPPGGEVAVTLRIPLPDELGVYALRLDLVDDKVIWFSQAGSGTADIRLAVDARAEGSDVHGLGATLALVEEGRREIIALPGTRVPIAVAAENTGRLTWESAPEPRKGCVALGGHLLDPSGRSVSRDILRAHLERPVGPAEAVQLRTSFAAPLVPGKYRLRLDLVQEGVCWFEQRGSIPLEVDVTVKEGLPESPNPGLLCARLEAVTSVPAAAIVGSEVPLALRVRNCGNTVWLREPRNGSTGHVTVGGHLLSASRDVVLEHDYFRAPLPRDIQPGDIFETSISLPWPLTSGSFVIELDMVDEGIAWFHERGSATLRLAVLATETTDLPVS
jgi:SAM-dependent methyltransferase